MAGPERIEWRPSALSEAFAKLGWYLAGAAVTIASVWVLFGSEPARLHSGQLNPLAVTPRVALIVGVLGAVPPFLELARRPLVAASSYGMTVRAGSWRTVVLPWARVAAVAVYRVGDDEYLFLACRDAPARSRSVGTAGDRPGWPDRGELRTALKRARRQGSGQPEALERFDLAVRMRDFVGEPYVLLSTLVAFAPDHVQVATDLTEAD